MLEQLDLHVVFGARSLLSSSVHAMMIRHYLGRWPGTVVLVCRLDCGGFPVGVITYSLPPRETYKRYGVSLCWELSRLWVDDAMPRNTETWFVAQTIRWIARNRQDVECLVSYADPSHGHSGLIYKAANWLADGRTDEGRKTPRCDYRGPDGKMYSRRRHVPDGIQVQRVARTSKFRFVYWLRRRS